MNKTENVGSRVRLVTGPGLDEHGEFMAVVAENVTGEPRERWVGVRLDYETATQLSALLAKRLDRTIHQSDASQE